MERMNQLLCVLCFILCFSRFSKSETFCVAKDDAPKDRLQAYVDYACEHVDCTAIQPGPRGLCYEPNTVENHGSYALDMYYRMNGLCDANLGRTTETDPSYGNCNYP